MKTASQLLEELNNRIQESLNTLKGFTENLNIEETGVDGEDVWDARHSCSDFWRVKEITPDSIIIIYHKGYYSDVWEERPDMLLTELPLKEQVQLIDYIEKKYFG